MKLVKIKTLGKDGKTYYPIYLIIDMVINGETQVKAVRIYTHKDDKNGFNFLSMSATYYPDASNIGQVVDASKYGWQSNVPLVPNEEKKSK